MQNYKYHKKEFEAANTKDFNPHMNSCVVASNLVALWSEEYTQLKNTIKELTKKADSLKSGIIKFMGDKEELLDQREMRIHSYTHITRKSFDEKTFQKEMPMLYAQYLTTKEYRRFV